jgi:O-antigen ligase
MSTLAQGTTSYSGYQSSQIEQQSLWFLSSAFLFRMGLALETFEIVRPLGVLVADYFFFSSLLLLLCSRERRLLKSKGSGVLAASAVILCGVMLSLIISRSIANIAAGPEIRIIVLFGLFAPLAVVHSKNIRQNLFFLIGGISINCLIAILTAWVSGDISKALAITPKVDIYAGQDIGRFDGLAGHSNILGFSAALAILVAVGLLLTEKKSHVRWSILLQILLCTVGGLLSGSRTFLVSLIPGLIILLFWRTLNRRVVLRGCIGLFVVWAGIHYLAPDLLTNYAGRFGATSAEDTENSGRLLTAGMALLEISQKPITGWGVDRFGDAGMMFLPDENDFLPAHVTFLHYWYAEGLLGAVGFLMLFILPAKHMIQILRQKPHDYLAKALRLGICVYLLLFVASNLHPILFNRFLYMPLFLFAGLTAQAPSSLKVRKVRRSIAPLPTPNAQATS